MLLDTHQLRPARYAHPLIVVVLVGLVALVASACAEPDLQVLRVSQEPPDGDGNYGVGLVERTFRVRVDETVDARLYLPLAPGTQRLAERASAPVLSLHGGLVAPEQYEWLNAHIASQGYVVIAPHHALELPLFAQGNALDVLEAARRASGRPEDLLYEKIDSGPGIAVGHSLGGVAAARAWLDAPGELSHLILLASLPNDADDVHTRRGDDAFVLSLTGSRDGRISPQEVARGARRFAAPTTIAVVEGMNHFQFVDGATASQRETDRKATIDTPHARQLVLRMIDEVLATHETGERDFWNGTSLWPEGVAPYAD